MRALISAVTIVIALIAGCSNTQDDKAALDSQEGFVCPPPGQVVYEAWGPHGLSKACEGADGQRNGSFFTAEHGHIVIRGSYEAGQKHGMWEWLDSNGRVVRHGRDDAPQVK